MKYSLKRACLRHLRDTFGLEDYRPGQKAAAHALLSGRDVMCILPTGAGKSLCWQLPAVVHDGLTVVVSPLIALMRDQVQHLSAIGIPAVSLDSLMSPQERQAVAGQIRAGQVRIVYVSPERLEQSGFRSLCEEMKPWLVVVDEAHCVVQWGEKFRPAYQNIQGFLQALPVRPVLCAMTATADESLQRAIHRNLGMQRPRRVLLPILRENLIYQVRTTLDRTGAILHLMQQDPCRTVIFCRTRQRTENLAALLAESGVAAAYYHAGMPREDRMGVQERFLAGEAQVLCATTAFGLGVDIPDIRRVVHDHLPDSLIDYVQQSGRAGRDGQEAECILLLEPNALVGKVFTVRKCRDRLRRRPIRGLGEWLRAHRGMRHVLKVMLASDCIPTGIARAFGGKAAPCGQCSACRRGKLVRKAPDVFFMTERQIRLWVLAWQRRALADHLHIRPSEVMPEEAMRRAAKALVYPAECTLRPEMDRLLRHFRRQRMHEDVGNGIE